MRIIYVGMLLVSLFIMSSITAVSQTADYKGSGLKFDTISKVILDNSNIRVYYLLNYLPNPAKPTIRKEAQTILQIGDKMNRFMDYNHFRGDSLNDASVKQKLDFGSCMMSLMNLKKKVRFNKNIIINKINNNVIYQRNVVLVEKYEYDEELPKIKWTLVKGDSVLSGYKCNKAIANYRGRNYIAWYAKELNLPFGPYVFGELPGLIFQIHDIQNHYSFTLNGLNKSKTRDPIYKWTGHNIIFSSREEVRKVYKNYCADPVKALMNTGKTIKISAAVRASVKSKPYNPMELK